MTSETESNPFELYDIIRGVPFPRLERFTRKNIEDAMDFEPEDGDTIVASYPKTGTTWMQYIVLQIRSKGQLFPSFDDAQYKVMPYIEMVGVSPVLAQSKPRFYKHHLPYDKVKKNDKSKCIYTYRHPEDTVVSYYHFINNMEPQLRLEMDDYVERFETGRIYYGNYFQHVLSYYEHREDGNVLMVSYEKLHANRAEEILRIAKFLGEEYYKSLLEDDQLLNKIIVNTSFDYMKKNTFMTHPDVPSGVREGPSEGAPPKVSFFRKGIVGDGKTVLSEAQRQGIKAAAEKILKNTPIFDEWYSK